MANAFFACSDNDLIDTDHGIIVKLKPMIPAMG